ncbi:L-threonylcarbamoyladenylate synthase [Leuconostocaceae bacterium ESL0723]|nr:L-threonylcarbamoyladenylate synthase [Leuconostocaceae bacterium ESL0723]
METQAFKPELADLKKAAQLIDDGELVAFPTETVYGLGADATNPAAVKKVFEAKGRPADNPLIVTVADPKQVADFAQVSAAAQVLMDHFWPGSLTIILPTKPKHLDDVVTGGLPTAAFRLPDNQATQELIKLAGVPLVGPSANTSGKPSPTTAAHVWHDMDHKIAGIIDDGPTTVGVESTVVDLSVSPATILRTGAVTEEELEQVLDEPVIDVTQPTAVDDAVHPKAPGMKYRHYAPDKPVVMFDPLDAGELAKALQGSDAVMALDDTLAQLPAGQTKTWSLGKDYQSASEQLFAGLRYFDDQGDVQRIYVERLPEIGLGRAYNNRLAKASGNQFFQAD